MMTVLMVVREKKKRSLMAKKVAMVWGIVVLAFVFTLNLQGIMAQVGPTNDTYQTGVAKVLNHLSLGLVDIRENSGDNFSEKMEIEEISEPVEKPVENFEEDSDENEAVFDGYVVESTETRVKLTNAAMQVWSQSFATVAFGVGLGGAGQALYVNGLSPVPKEIVQNEYASLLLETGLVGMVLFVLTLVLVMRAIWKSRAKAMIVCLLIAYGITLLFFSGLVNVLQIYLLPVVLVVLMVK